MTYKLDERDLAAIALKVMGPFIDALGWPDRDQIRADLERRYLELLEELDVKGERP